MSKSVSFAASSAPSSSAPVTNTLQQLIQFQTDQQRLDRLKHVWENENKKFIEELMKLIARQLETEANEYVSTKERHE